MSRAPLTLVRWLLRLAGPALLGLVLLSSDLSQISALLRRTDLGLVGASVLLGLGLLSLKGVRWKLILDAWGVSVPVSTAAGLYSLGVFLGTLTPGQSGDFAKAWYLRRSGHPLGPCLLAALLDRGFDLGGMALVALAGSYRYRALLPGRSWLVIAALLAGLGCLIALLSSRRLRALGLRRLAPGLDQQPPLRAPGKLLTAALVSLAALGCVFLRLYLVALALGLLIPIWPFLALVAISTLVGLLSFAGIGTRDLVLVALLHGLAQTGQITLLDGRPLAVEQAGATAVALSTLFLAVHLTNVIAGSAMLLRYPLADLLVSRQQAESRSSADPGTR